MKKLLLALTIVLLLAGPDFVQAESMAYFNSRATLITGNTPTAITITYSGSVRIHSMSIINSGATDLYMAMGNSQPITITNNSSSARLEPGDSISMADLIESITAVYFRAAEGANSGIAEIHAILYNWRN